MPFVTAAPLKLTAGSIPIADLADPTTGKVIGSASNAAAAVNPPGFEFGYTQITAAVNITDTVEGTGTALLTSSAITFDGAPVMFEFFCPAVITDTAAAGDLVHFTMFEGASLVSNLGFVRTIATAAPFACAVYLRFRFTPSAAAHTYKLCAYATSTTGTPKLSAGAGTTGTDAPCWIRFTKV